ncbi:MAG: hypothetical protein IJQ33_11385, partial [Clostridia bacterium]|nr:hypothetical protein [Clostridia bacterium]
MDFPVTFIKRRSFFMLFRFPVYYIEKTRKCQRFFTRIQAVLKKHFKLEKDTRQGAPRPLAPSARDFIPCNPTGEKTSWGRENNFRLLRRIKWKIEGFWPTESRENPRG